MDVADLTIPEAAERLRVIPETVRVWLRTKRLRGYKVNATGGGRGRGEWRIREEDLQAFIEQRMNIPKE